MSFKKILFGMTTTLALVTGFGSAVNIASCDDLANVNNDLSTGYTLTQDLDCSGSGNSIMIGTRNTPFLGVFDGGGHTITVNIYINESYLGLFRKINNATISNVTISGSIISTKNFDDPSYIGGLAGLSDNSTISNSHSSAFIQAEGGTIGGLVGYSSNTSILLSSSSANMSGGEYSHEVGGLVGGTQANTILENSYAIGNVLGGSLVGGLIGYARGITHVVNSYAIGDVTATNQQAGGLIGAASYSTIDNSYAMGAVTTAMLGGGLVGYMDASTTSGAYSIGLVTGGGTLGGLIGDGNISSNTTNSFWDTTTSSRPTSALSESGMSTAQLKDINTYLDNGRNITGSSTYLNNGYPYLARQVDSNSSVWHIYQVPVTPTPPSGGGGGGGSITKDSCPDGDTSPSYYDHSCGSVADAWKSLYARCSSGGVSSVSNPITVKSFVTDVFMLLHITKSIHREADSDTQVVPDTLIVKVMQILQKLLSK